MFRHLVRSLSLLIIMSSCNRASSRFTAEFADTFDTMTSIVGYAKNDKVFSLYANAIFDKMTELNQLFDIYHEYANVNNCFTINMNAGISPVAVDQAIIDLLIFDKHGYFITDGAVNTAMGAVLSLWHEQRTTGNDLPDIDSLVDASAFTDINDVLIDEQDGTVFLNNVRVSIDVGATAKAYAAGIAVSEAVKLGADSLLLNAGGNVTAVGRPADGRETWSVGVQDPDRSVDGMSNLIDTLYMVDKTVSCSGGYQRFYMVDGIVYNHIIDPNTLFPARVYKNVTVVHDVPVMADLLSTALFILPYEQGREIAEREGAEAYWIFEDGTEYATDGYKSMSEHFRRGQ